MLCMLKKSILLLLCLSLAFAGQCPINIDSSRYSELTGGSLSKASDFYDAIYEIKLNSVDDSYSLVGYKINEVDNVANIGYEAEQFTFPANSNMKILAVSQLGNCIVIDSRPSVLVFNTSDSNFTLAQNITQNGNFIGAKVNDDCSIVRLTMEDGTQKVYQDEVENKKISFPTNSLFDAYFIYGISAGQLKKVSKDEISTIDLGTNAFKTTPVSIMNKKDLNALIVLTSNQAKTDYTITIVNTKDDSEAYSKTWTSSQFSGQFRAEYSPEGSFIVITDDDGFLEMLEIAYFQEDNDLLQVGENFLQDEQYQELFGPDAVISSTKDAIIVYFNGKLTYFQPADGFLYYLAQIVKDLEVDAVEWADQEKNPELAFTSTFVYVDESKDCDIFPSETINDTQIQFDEDGGEFQDGQGNIILCAPQCLNCNANGQCKVCSLGYALNSAGECVLCQGCRSCLPSKPQICITCFKPKVFNQQTKKCQSQKCDDPLCLDCDIKGNCLACPKGYSVFKNLCAKCQEGCYSCKDAGQGTCDQLFTDCKEGFVYYPSVSKQVKFSCVECAAGCISCLTSDISSCTGCIDGYYSQMSTQAGKLVCKSCLDNCIMCTNGTICSKCGPDYKLNKAGTKCQPKCDDDCATCSQTNITECLSCFVGGKLSGKECIADLSCNLNNSCKACVRGYVLRAGKCLQCSTGVPNCIGCSSSNNSLCTRCAAGFYISSNKCLSCPSQCTTCIDNETCASCSTGFYIVRPLSSTTGKCLACRKTCKTCIKHPFLCTSCNTGFTLEGTKCININRVNYEITLSADMSLVVMVVRTFIQIMMDMASKAAINTGKTLKLTSDQMLLKGIRKGSAVLNGAMSTGDPSISDAVLNSFGSLDGMELEGGFSIISAKATTAGPKLSVQPQSTNLGLILGVSIPVGLIVLIAVIILIYRISQRKEEDLQKVDSSKGQMDNESEKQVRPYQENSDKI